MAAATGCEKMDSFASLVMTWMGWDDGAMS
jgi:hypothetical protein